MNTYNISDYKEQEICIIECINKISDIKEYYLNSEGNVRSQHKAADDAIWFISNITTRFDKPSISIADDGEIVIEWRKDNKNVIAGFDGDGYFGYALSKNGKFYPGKGEGIIGEKLPEDLLIFLSEI